jgi:hypothetical protein
MMAATHHYPALPFGRQGTPLWFCCAFRGESPSLNGLRTGGKEPGGLTVSALAAYLPALVFVAGVGQLVLIVASLAIPRVLRWTGWGWWAHVWVLGWLALPLPILFHPPFLRGVGWPLIGMEWRCSP